MNDLSWQNTGDARHVVITAGATKAVLCDFRGTAEAPHLPCNACLDELWATVSSALPVAAR